MPPLSEPGLTAWYRLGVTPGEIGNSLIVGHVDTQTGPAVFYRLGAVKPGNQIKVTRQDGRTAVFRVDKVALYDKNDLPIDDLYGVGSTARLHLVTCGGPLEGGHHVGNVVVTATLLAP